MITKLTIRNFKRFEEVTFPLGNPVVLIGPNNSGKTTALQALSLWEFGLKSWYAKRGQKDTQALKKTGVALNRKDIISTPVTSSNLLWHNARTARGVKVNGNNQAELLKIEIEVEGTDGRQFWVSAMEFYYTNEESFYCRPIPARSTEETDAISIAPQALKTRVAFLHPMSGLALVEPRYDRGRINVLLGEGRTSEVLRNLCYEVYVADEKHELWKKLTEVIHGQFRVTLEPPIYDTGRGEVTLAYKNPDGVRLDVSTSGRGFQQTLLLFAFMGMNPGSLILLDEPDAHLEIIRQKEAYGMLVEWATDHDNQLVIATHSEAIIDDAASRPDDHIIAFLGAPRRLDDKRNTLRRALQDIRFSDFFQAEQAGWVLYVEDRTDYDILRSFAAKLNNEEAAERLRRAFVRHIGNQPSKGRAEYYPLQEVIGDLCGLMINDHDVPQSDETRGLVHYRWKRHEIENYFCQPDTLVDFIRSAERERQGIAPDLFEQGGMDWNSAFVEILKGRIPPAAYENLNDKWWGSVKATDDYLDVVFREFSERLRIPLVLRKANYYRLVEHLHTDHIDDEVREVVNIIARMPLRSD